jgi:predicted metal-binding membrane protein
MNAVPTLAAAAAAARPTALSSLRTFAWRHPEWWLLTICAVAWVMLAAGVAAAPGWPLCIADVTGDFMGLWRRIEAAGLSGALGPPMTEVALMVVAMMPPLVILPVRHAAFRSLWWRRHRAIAGVLVGYTSVWMLVGVATVIANFALIGAQPDSDRSIGALGLAVAAGWQLTPFKLRALAACNRSVPLVPNGWRADLSCLRYGLVLGRHCVASCWALMLCPFLAAHDLVLMVAVIAVAVAERYLRRRLLGLTAACLALAAVAWPI